MTNCKLTNLNPEQVRELQSGELLPVMEMFYSIQGEGYNTGKAAFFIRIGGCDIACSWCDVKESWDASVHPLTSIDSIANQIQVHAAQSVVITGGEPFMYNLDLLCARLKNQQIRLFIETSGTYPLSGNFDWICVSPKAQQAPRKDMLGIADELKVIIHDESDFEWAEKHLRLVPKKCLLYLQPEWSNQQIMTPAIIDYVLKNPHWMISIQSHKFMNIP